ncbi:MAG: polyprenyl synthetase family protein [Candidatus Micrarchaeia archaeon]
MTSEVEPQIVGADMQSHLKEWGAKCDEQINEYLKDFSDQSTIDNLLGSKTDYDYDIEAIRKGAIDPITYMLNLGGKRWRPVLMLDIISALGKDPNKYVKLAIIPEIIHNATLLHDDVEDSSEKRRGADAVYVKFGVDVAVNVGAMMYYMAPLFLFNDDSLSKETVFNIIKVYQREMLRVHIGQTTDIAWHRGLVDPFGVTERQYLQMVLSKTGVLPRAAAMMGGIIGGADDELVEALGRFGASIGVAFQIKDDLLNITPSQLAENKGGVGDDISEGKITLMVIKTFSAASDVDRERLKEILSMHTKDKKLINEAISIIDKYGAKKYCAKKAKEITDAAWSDVDKLLPESKGKENLKMLADFLINRSI